MNTYTVCLSMIQRERYKDKEDVAFKLNIFFLNDQLSQTQYEELTDLLNAA